MNMDNNKVNEIIKKRDKAWAEALGLGDIEGITPTPHNIKDIILRIPAGILGLIDNTLSTNAQSVVDKLLKEHRKPKKCCRPIKKEKQE